ncbi:hypothetical protein B0A48_07785 [Cryoendolithus antarcticus]|uniref:BTB domain-containing protein n=1 Tax=Cryoendolithus antarcticus TaxID=1507870 RepID=A0A1V8T739_9PEZI|nr:hypothetical protein B0A48_07785 [Cryoendolithus antarcticus]
MADQEPSREGRKLDFTDTITVIVGNRYSSSQPEEFRPPANIFKSAIKMHESYDPLRNELKLPLDEAGAFRTYLQYLDNGVLDLALPPTVTERANVRLYTQIHALAIRLKDEETANHVADNLFGYLASRVPHPTASVLHSIIANTEENTGLFRLCMDYFVHYPTLLKIFAPGQPGIKDTVECYAKDLVDEGLGLMKSIMLQGPAARPKCYYREHDRSHPVCL